MGRPLGRFNDDRKVRVVKAVLPELSLSGFASRLRASVAPLSLSDSVLESLHVHHEELRRWSRVHALVGSNEGPGLIERHYAEALAAMPLMPAGSRFLDIGSGAGFPGLILAAAGDHLRATLVESRAKKAAFLRSTSQRMGQSVVCLQDRIDMPLPAELPEAVDFVALRAVKLPDVVWQSLARRFGLSVRALVWAGAADPRLPLPWRVSAEVALPSGGQRRILCYSLTK